MSSDSKIPIGWSHNPSAWSRRLPMVVLALAGCGIASYLAFYQLRIIDHVWEPVFGEGSHRILRESWIVRLLPVPDAALGAIAYFTDAVFALIGSSVRWQENHWAVYLSGANAAALALAAIFLLLAQPLILHAGCSLCIASACLSLLLIWPAAEECVVAVRYARLEKKNRSDHARETDLARHER